MSTDDPSFLVGDPAYLIKLEHERQRRALEAIRKINESMINLAPPVIYEEDKGGGRLVESLGLAAAPAQPATPAQHPHGQRCSNCRNYRTCRSRRRTDSRARVCYTSPSQFATGGKR